MSIPINGDTISIMVGVGKEDEVSRIKILSHSETPGLGANVAPL